MNWVLKEDFVYLRARKLLLFQCAADMKNHRWLFFNLNFYLLYFESECLLVLLHTRVQVCVCSCVKAWAPSSPWMWSWLWIVWSVWLLLLGGSLSLSPELGLQGDYRTYLTFVCILGDPKSGPHACTAIALPTKPLHSLDSISKICCVLSTSVMFHFITRVQWGGTAPTSASQSVGPKIVLRSDMVIDLKKRPPPKKTKNKTKTSEANSEDKMAENRVQLLPDVCVWGWRWPFYYSM